MGNYRLSESATDDLDALYLYGITNYGLKQADEYYSDLTGKFEILFHHPDWGSDYEHIVPGLRRYEFGSHSIYYQHKGHHILIVRVLGYRQDLARHA